MTPDRLKRDLEWILASEPLMAADAWCRFAGPVGEDIPLPSPPDPHHFRLGQHFEKTLTAWLAAQQKLINHNVQVIDGKHTIGEFDLIVDNDGQTEHWEAAIKFYLGAIDLSDMDNWLGPNTDDRFGTKYERLVSHQLRLSENPVAAAQLADKGIKVEISRCFMKGRLFHPWRDFANNELTVPDGVNPDHERGWWIPYGEFLRDFDDRGYRYVYLTKSLWLAPLTQADFTSPLSFLELVEFLQSPHVEQATHVAIVDDGGEVSRGFVVNQQWLNRTKTP
jgi:hypothetical protein